MKGTSILEMIQAILFLSVVFVGIYLILTLAFQIREEGFLGIRSKGKIDLGPEIEFRNAAERTWIFSRAVSTIKLGNDTFEEKIIVDLGNVSINNGNTTGYLEGLKWFMLPIVQSVWNDKFSELSKIDPRVLLATSFLKPYVPQMVGFIYNSTIYHNAFTNEKEEVIEVFGEDVGSEIAIIPISFRHIKGFCEIRLDTVS